MAKCIFCSKNIESGKGVTLVEDTGKINNFCSRKCRKSKKMGRDSKKLPWAKVKIKKE